MENKEFGKLLEVRTKNFALEIIKLSAQITNSVENRVLKNQIVKSGTSIGANYREANRSRSRADFKNKIGICQGETNETIYWLELIIELKKSNDIRVTEIYNEARELLAIFTSILKSLS